MKKHFAVAAALCASVLACDSNSSGSGDKGPVYVPLTGPLTGGGNTIFNVNVEVGTPPQVVPLAFDTGSPGMVTYDASCSLCGPATATFNPQTSSTWEALTCDSPGCPAPNCTDPKNCEAPLGCSHCYESTNNCQWCGYYYNNFDQEIGYWGSWGSDIVKVGDVSVRLGLGQTQNALNKESSFVGTTSGILGMMQTIPGRGYLSDRSANMPTFISTAGASPGEALPYSICLTDTGGQLLLGSMDTEHMQGEVSRLDTRDDPTSEAMFLIELQSMTVGNTEIAPGHEAYEKNPVAFDAGTGTWELPDALYEPIIDSLCNDSSDKERCLGLVAKLKDGCSALSSADIALFPPIESVIAGSTFIMQPEEYLFKGALGAISLAGKECAEDEYTLTLGGAASPGVSLFGFAFMRHFTLYYDGPNAQVALARQKGCLGP